MSLTLPTSSPPAPTVNAVTNNRYVGVNANPKNNEVGSKPKTVFAFAAPPLTHANTYAATIYGTSSAPAPGTRYTKEQREQHIDGYANRVNTLIGDIESDQEGKRNIKFQKARQFMEPSGYFSGGLLAAGYDPHEKINVTFTSYTGMGKPDVLTDTDIRTYFAWEIAAGALAHDKVQRGGPINFQFMSIEKSSRGKVDELESVGHKLQDHWENTIATPMRDASGELAQRSGKADVYVIRGTLQSLSNNQDSFGKLSHEAKDAINRTLKHNGQVIIPNVYGYPLSGHAFIPYTPYDGNYENRPNQGLMIDLKKGAVHEVKSDDDFANWAKNNRATLHTRFNASDRQGGHDAHWPKAGDVLDTLIRGKNATYPGYENLVKDQAIPVRELFNYTRARGEHYQLKFGNLNSNMASKYQEQNANNAVWTDQTEVFGSSQQSWKAAKNFWSNTFGYVPVVGNTGNIVFGIHDGIYGKTAEDRVGGSSAAVISALQLAHEIASAGVAEREEPPATVTPPALRDIRWRYNSPSSDFELIREPKAPPANDSASIITEEPHPGTSSGTDPIKKGIPQPLPMSPSLIPMAQYAVPDGETLIKNATRNASGVYRMTDSTGVFRQFVRLTDETGTSKIFEISGRYRADDAFAKIIDPNTGAGLMVVTPGRDGEWARAPGDGGKWWIRTPSPTPSNESETVTRFTQRFIEADGSSIAGAEKFDDYLNLNQDREYVFSSKFYEDSGTIKRKLTTSWTVDDDNFSVSEGEKAQHSPFSESEYSTSFAPDLNREDYAVVTKQTGGDARTELNYRSGDAADTIKHRLVKFEAAIPDPALRARISEVAHQGASFPALLELMPPLLKEGNSVSAGEKFFTIGYDPAGEVQTVTAVTHWKLRMEMEDGLVTTRDLDITSTRTFKIRGSNELDDNGFSIDKSAPTKIEISTLAAM